MDDFCRELNIHKPRKYLQNKKLEKFTLRTGKVLGLKMYVLNTMCKPVVLYPAFLTRATHLYGLYYMLKNDKHYWIIDIPLNVIPKNDTTN